MARIVDLDGKQLNRPRWFQGEMKKVHRRNTRSRQEKHKSTSGEALPKG